MRYEMEILDQNSEFKKKKKIKYEWLRNGMQYMKNSCEWGWASPLEEFFE